jgi:hypothetical protein
VKRCPECGAKHDDAVLTCDCGTHLGDLRAEEEKRGASSEPVYGGGSEPERPVFLVGGLRIFAGLSLAGGAIGLLLFMGSSIWTGIGIAAAGLLAALVLGALSANLELLADIAENSNVTAANSERIVQLLDRDDQT